MKTEKYNVTGMTCAACQANVTRCVGKLDGVETVDVSLLANQMTVTYDENKMDEGRIAGIGTHNELFQNCEEYREICLSQFSESEAANA